MDTPKCPQTWKKVKNVKQSSPETSDDIWLTELSKQPTQISTDLPKLKNRNKKTVKWNHSSLLS